MRSVKSFRRTLRLPSAKSAQPDFPYTMRLPHDRTLYVEVPGRWVKADRDGTPAFLPDGVRFLDRIRALALKVDGFVSPAFVAALRDAMGQNQAEFGRLLGVDKMTVSRWERGVVRPSRESMDAIEGLRRKIARRGIIIPS